MRFPAAASGGSENPSQHTGTLLLAAAALLALLMSVSSAAAQTADDLFNDAVLHRLDIYVNTRDWRFLRDHWQGNDYVPANFVWRGRTARNAGIRSRGNYTRSPNKLGLRVDFNRYTAGQTFLGLKSLVLDNHAQDASNIRESTTFTFMRRMGIPVSREAHAAVYVNNAYYGLYTIIEEIDAVALSNWFGESDGYLFEYDWQFEFWHTYLGPDPTTYAPMFSPKTHETDSMEALYGPIEAMFRTINEAPDESFVADVSEYLDLPLFMRQTAIQDFMAELDGLLGFWGTNNFYLYRFENRNLSQFIPWDEDLTFIDLQYPLFRQHDSSVLMRRALNVPELRQLYFDTLESCAALASEVDGEDPRGWLEREIVRQLELIRTAALLDRNINKAEFAQAWADMVRFGRLRAEFVRCQVRKMTDPIYANEDCTPPPPEPPPVLERADPRARAVRIKQIK